MNRVFIVGDIHGCSKTFRKLLLEKIEIRITDKIYCLGDYVDRGPDSKGVIDFILQLREQGYRIHTLRGNHEQMMLTSEKNKSSKDLWRMNGGDKTLESFTIDSIHQLASKYLSFLRRTKYYIKTKDFILVHAGLNCFARDLFANKDILLWIRDLRVDPNKLGGRIVIHGHSPMNRDYILSQPFEGSFNLDGGCVYKHKKGFGSLFALNFYEKKLIEQENVEDNVAAEKTPG